jgi:hypothetical protein
MSAMTALPIIVLEPSPPIRQLNDPKKGESLSDANKTLRSLSSNSDDRIWEVLRDEWHALPMVSPNSYIWIIQSILIFGASLWNVFWNPIEITFDAVPIPEPYFTWMTLIFWFIYLIDMYLQAHTSYFDELGTIVAKPEMTRMRYFKSTFILDLFATTPWRLLFHDVFSEHAVAGLQVLCLLFIYRWHNIAKQHEVSLYFSKVIGISVYAMIVFVIFHIMGCASWLFQRSLPPNQNFLQSPDIRLAIKNIQSEDNPFIKYAYLFLFIINGTCGRPYRFCGICF